MTALPFSPSAEHLASSPPSSRLPSYCSATTELSPPAFLIHSLCFSLPLSTQTLVKRFHFWRFQGAFKIPLTTSIETFYLSLAAAFPRPRRIRLSAGCSVYLCFLQPALNMASYGVKHKPQGKLCFTFLFALALMLQSVSVWPLSGRHFTK